MYEDTKHIFFDRATKVFAGIGIAASVFLLAWGSVFVFRGLPGGLSGLAAVVVGLQSRLTTQERIVISASQNPVSSGSITQLFWQHRGKESDGSYTLSYECREGLHFERAHADGSVDILFCNTPVNILESESEIALRAVSTDDMSIDVPVRIAFTQNNESRVHIQGDIRIQVLNSSLLPAPDPTLTSTTTPQEETPSTTTPPSFPPPPPAPGSPTEETRLFASTTGAIPSDPNGQPDLKAAFLATGMISRVNNEFTATSTVPKNMRAAVKFEVINLGTKESGSWRFNAALPTFPHHIFSSQTQPSLFPGDRIEFTLGFDSIKDIGENEVVVNVDPAQSIRNEVTRDNNIIRTTIIVIEPIPIALP